MSDKPMTREQIRAWRLERNRTIIELCHTAGRNGHEALMHNLAGSILLTPVDAALLDARASHGG